MSVESIWSLTSQKHENTINMVKMKLENIEQQRRAIPQGLDKKEFRNKDRAFRKKIKCVRRVLDDYNRLNTDTWCWHYFGSLNQSELDRILAEKGICSNAKVEESSNKVASLFIVKTDHKDLGEIQNVAIRMVTKDADPEEEKQFFIQMFRDMGYNV